MSAEPATKVIPIKDERPTCSDHDEDCNDIRDYVHCWLHAPEKGMCPYLRAKDPS